MSYNDLSCLHVTIDLLYCFSMFRGKGEDGADFMWKFLNTCGKETAKNPNRFQMLS